MTTPTPNPEGRWGRQAAADATPPPSSPSSPSSPAVPAAPPQVADNPFGRTQSPQAQGWGAAAPQQPQQQSGSPRPRQTLDLSPQVVQWSVIGVAVVLGILYIVSYFMNWAHYPGNEATINGFGWMTLEDSSNGNNFASNIFALVGMLVVFTLGWGVFKLLWSDDAADGVRDILISGAIAISYALFAFMFKMAMGLFITDGEADQVDRCRRDAKSLGASSTVVDDLCGTYRSPFTDPETGGGPVLCLLLGLFTVLFAVTIAFMVPQTRRIIEGFGIPVPSAVPTVNLGGSTMTRTLTRASDEIPSAPTPSRPSVEQGIQNFWAFWAGESAKATELLNQGASTSTDINLMQFENLLTFHVTAVDPNLIWRFEPGRDGSARTLVVTAHVYPELRGAARRWLEAAPGPDADWSFSDYRAATPNQPVHVGNSVIDPAGAKVGIIKGNIGLALAVWHPQITGAAHAAAAVELVNATIGDRSAARWIYSAVSITREMEPMYMLSELPTMIERREDKWAEHVEKGLYLSLEEEDPNGLPLTISTFQPLLPAWKPLCDLYIFVRLTIRPELYEDGSAVEPIPVARELVDKLKDFVRDRDGVVACEVMNPLSAGVECYLNSYSATAGEDIQAIRAMAGQWSLGEHEVTVTEDPAWKAVAEYRD